MTILDTLRTPYRRARRAAKFHRALARTRPLFSPGHYYSPLTTRDDAERAVGWLAKPDVSTVDLDEAAINALAEELAPAWADLRTDRRYHVVEDPMFGTADAAAYHAILRHVKPARVIEVGSGFSTAVALDTIETHGLGTELSCIEPNPERLQELLEPADDVSLQASFVQDVPLAFYDRLQAGDILFIDSTHVVKPGSDVVWTTLRVLPRLKPGVLVHIHDMFWPFEYRPEWLREHRDWNELYFIHAFLSGNKNWRVWFFNDKVWQERGDLVGRYRPDTLEERPGGLWLEKLA